jgi:hypothetical protein
MQKTRQKIKKPSAEFFKFLEMVNLVRGSDLPVYRALVRHYEPECVEKWGNTPEAVRKARDVAGALIFKFLLNSPEKFRDYIYEEANPKKVNPIDTDRVLNSYETFRNNCETLEHVTGMLNRKSMDLQSVQKRADQKTFIAMTPRTVIINLDSSGEFDYEVVGFDLFKGFDFTRFRICPICENIFWTARKDKKACSDSNCSNAYRQRIYQSRNKAKISEQRSRNYRYKKANRKQSSTN